MFRARQQLDENMQTNIIVIDVRRF